MPKVNTHLYFAKNIKNNNEKLSRVIDKYSNYFYLGSIMPDVFYYSKNEEITKVSDIIHGKDGTPTNKLVFDLLNTAKENKDEELLAFIFGFITHCYLDIVFHPIIFYFTGNYYDQDAQKRKTAFYRHNRMEVYLDQRISKEFYFNKLINSELFNNNLISILSKSLNIPKKETASSFKRHYFFNSIFHIKFIFKILLFLNKIYILNNEEKLVFFYEDLHNDEKIKEEIIYRDLFTGEVLKTNLNELLNISNLRTNRALISAYKYYNGEEARGQAEINIAGESLDTGSNKYKIEEIKFTK